VYDDDDTETVSDKDTWSDEDFIEDEEMVYPDDQGINVTDVTEEDDATSSDDDEIEVLIETSDEVSMMNNIMTTRNITLALILNRRMRVIRQWKMKRAL